ncbi:MAG: hypothetical protein SVY10_15275 [Thermodesulfobacteriota bacterium]|nr:hypothetical protein [Thermodesulfobacteriota bacterium]
MGKEIVTKSEFQLANTGLVEELKENLEGVEIDFPRIKIVHPAQLFEMPTGDTVKTFRGIILFHHSCNAWWAESYDESGGGVSPDCSSLDSIHPNLNSNDVQAKECRACPKNQWGTADKGNGKACKNMKRIYILCENDLLPSCLSIPPACKRSIDQFFTLTSMKGILLRAMVTEFRLKAAKSKDGKNFSEPDLNYNLEKTNLMILTEAQQKVIQNMRKAYMPLMKSWEIIENVGEGM